MDPNWKPFSPEIWRYRSKQDPGWLVTVHEDGTIFTHLEENRTSSPRTIRGMRLDAGMRSVSDVNGPAYVELAQVTLQHYQSIRRLKAGREMLSGLEAINEARNVLD